MGAVQTARHPQDANSPSFESVWAVLDRVGERLDKVGESQKELTESQKELTESQKELTESQKETDRLIKELRESQKATDRQQQKTESELGRLSKRMGDVVEFMVAPDLCEKFKEFGFNFSQSSQKIIVSDKANKISFEIDVFLENYSKAMLTEVKTTPTTEDVKEHVKRLQKMRKYADLHGDKRIFLGAVAGVVITDNVRKYVLKQGFFVIEPSGEGFNITSPKGKPKEW